MNDILRSPAAAPTIAAAYEKDGYYFPYDVTSEAEAAGLLADLEAAEAEVRDDRARLSLLTRALAAQADWIVSSDAHLLNLKHL